VAIAKKDVPLIVMSSVILIAAGLAVAAAILFVTAGDGEGESEGPVQIGLASAQEKNIDEEGPAFLADPTGNDRSFWLTKEDGEIVALVIEVPGRPGCIADYRGRDETFVDCDGEPIETEELDRYALSVSTDEDNEGALLVDLDTVQPAPARESAPATAG